MSFETFIQHVAPKLVLKDGIWFSENTAGVSYPEESHDTCLEIESNSFWFVQRNKNITAVIENIPSEGYILDVGGGNGYVSYALEQAGQKVALLEPGIIGVLNAEKRGVSNIVCSTMEGAGLKDESIDAIGIFDVLEHIEEDELFLESVNKALKTKGKIYITVPSYQVLWSDNDRFAGHCRRYTVRSLQRKLNNAGFNVEYSTYFFSILPFTIFLFRTIPSWFGKKREFENSKKQHSQKKGLLNKMLQKLWDMELRRISNNKKIMFGGSCLIAASKK